MDDGAATHTDTAIDALVKAHRATLTTEAQRSTFDRVAAVARRPFTATLPLATHPFAVGAVSGGGANGANGANDAKRQRRR